MVHTDTRTKSKRQHRQVGWKLRVSILTDAARALEFLHGKSLIHRDIKSPNILLDSQHRCKIADFGMARQLGSNMTVVGTGEKIDDENEKA